VALYVLAPMTIPRINGFATTLTAMQALSRDLAANPAATLPPTRQLEQLRFIDLPQLLYAPGRPNSWTALKLSDLGQSLQIIASFIATGMDGKLAAALARQPVQQAAAAVRAKGEHRSSNAIVYVGPDQSWYWQLNADCVSQITTLQALTGRAMLLGLPPQSRNCVFTRDYGLVAYGPASRSVAGLPEELCQMARHRGFGRVWSLRPGGKIDDMACR
jgi:hypothetical protein